jgi:hypothetical protein
MPSSACAVFSTRAGTLADSLKVGTTTLKRAASRPAEADFDWPAIAGLDGWSAGPQLFPVRVTPALYLFGSKERSPKIAPKWPAEIYARSFDAVGVCFRK